MRLKFFALSIGFLSCIAAPASQADVIALDGAVVVDNGRHSDDDDHDRDRGRSDARDTGYNYGRGYSGDNNDRVLIYNGNTSANGGDTFIMKDGRFIRAEDGTYDLGNGQSINVDQGKVNGNVGTVEIRN